MITQRHVNPEKHIGLVKHLAKRFHRRFPIVDFDDLVQAGSIGLMRACEHFDGSKGVFSSYATHSIWREFWRELVASRLVRIPEGRYRDSRFVKGTISSLDAGGFEPVSDRETPEATVERHEISNRVQAVLAELDEASRALVLGRLEGRTHRELGEQIGRSHEIARLRTLAIANRIRRRLIDAGLGED